MTKRSLISKLIGAQTLALLASLLLPVHLSGQSRDVAVVVNPNNPVTNLSVIDLRKILSGQKRSWPGGTPVKIIVRGPGCLERVVLLRILGMSEGEYKQYWTSRIFAGDVDAEPMIVPSFGMTKEAANVFPGAIALVDTQSIQPGMNVKVIKVNGLMPGDSGYPVH